MENARSVRFKQPVEVSRVRRVVAVRRESGPSGWQLELLEDGFPHNRSREDFIQVNNELPFALQKQHTATWDFFVSQGKQPPVRSLDLRPNRDVVEWTVNRDGSIRTLLKSHAGGKQTTLEKPKNADSA